MVAQSLGTPLSWSGFTSIVPATPALNPGVSHCRPLQIRMREAFSCTAACLAVPLAVNLAACFRFGRERAARFFTGYVIEKTLSVDKISGAFLLITAFKLTPRRGAELLPECNPLFRLIQRPVPSVADYRVPRFTAVANRGVPAPSHPPGGGAPAAATSVCSPHHRSIPRDHLNHESRPPLETP